MFFTLFKELCFNYNLKYGKHTRCAPLYLNFLWKKTCCIELPVVARFGATYRQVAARQVPELGTRLQTATELVPDVC